MSGSLALATLQLPVPTPDGQLTLGGVTAPGHVWADYLVRCLERCGDVPEAIAGRVRCRAHLDALFRGAGVVRCWPTGSKAAGMNVAAIRDGARLCVRLGDTTSAVLLDHGTYWQGPLMQWRCDSLFGPVAELAAPMTRFSAKGEQAKLLQEKA